MDKTGGQSRCVDSITGALKKLAGSFCYLLAAVNRAGVTARGVVWLTVSREIPIAPKPVRKVRARSSDSEPAEVGLLFATEPNRRCLQFNLTIQDRNGATKARRN